GGWSATAGWQWIVHPMGGTLNYSRGVAGATCSIACIRDGQPVVGAIAEMTAGGVYRARAGTGTILASGTRGESTRSPTTSPAGAARVFLEFGWEDLDTVMVGRIRALGRTRPRVIPLVGGAAYHVLDVAYSVG